MADIKINRISTMGDYKTETAVEVNGMEYGADELTKAVLRSLAESNPPENAQAKAAVTIKPEEEQDAPHNMRTYRPQHITPDILKAAINAEQLDSVLQPFDEIDIPLDTGGTVTVVCGYVEPEWARFVLKDCWDEAVMNEEPTNKTGYYKSKGRKHVLEDILPHIDPEWRGIIKPRKMVEIIDGETVEYTDPMWLPSATDMFGPSEDGYWKDLDDSFQLPIFEKERDRVKECGDNGTYPYWLRSVSASLSYTFRYVGTGGSGNINYAYYSFGFAPGFDI